MPPPTAESQPSVVQGSTGCTYANQRAGAQVSVHQSAASPDTAVCAEPRTWHTDTECHEGHECQSKHKCTCTYKRAGCHLGDVEGDGRVIEVLPLVVVGIVLDGGGVGAALDSRKLRGEARSGSAIVLCLAMSQAETLPYASTPQGVAARCGAGRGAGSVETNLSQGAPGRSSPRRACSMSRCPTGCSCSATDTSPSQRTLHAGIRPGPRMPSCSRLRSI